jgi:transcriptional regulator GlxA family with amidase domain
MTRPRLQIAVLVYDGFDELDAVAPFEVLQVASRLGGPFAVELVVAEPGSRLSGANGMPFDASSLRALASLTPDVVVVPGGGWNARSEVGAWAEYRRGVIPGELRRLHERGVVIASVCTGSMLLAASGILDGRHATTHHAAIDDLRKHPVQIESARVVDDGDIVTAGGVTSGLDLALWLVERLASPELADQVASRLEYGREGDVWRSGTWVQRDQTPHE